jgi:hypothetical protein
MNRVVTLVDPFIHLHAQIGPHSFFDLRLRHSGAHGERRDYSFLLVSIERAQVTDERLPEARIT